MTILNASLLKYFPYEEAHKVDALTRRKALLDSSDWTQIPDCPLSNEKKQEWAIFRQALRDITKQVDYPIDVVWPVPPT